MNFRIFTVFFCIFAKYIEFNPDYGKLLAEEVR